MMLIFGFYEDILARASNATAEVVLEVIFPPAVALSSLKNVLVKFKWKQSSLQN